MPSRTLLNRSGRFLASALAACALAQPFAAWADPPTTRVARQQPASRQAAQQPLETQPADLQRLNLESFDYVWETVRSRHYDATVGGADWEAAREKYRPLVAEAASVDGARRHMQEMIDALGQSHMSIIPGSAYDALSTDEEDEDENRPVTRRGDRDGETGVRLRLVDVEERTVLVTEVAPGSGGESAGVKPGWQLVRIGKSDIQEVVGKLAESLTARGHGKPEMYASFALEKRLQGPVGTNVIATFLDGEGQEQTVEIPRQTAAGEVARLGALPPMRVNFESRRIEQDGVTLGYISFNAFLDPSRLMPQFREAIVEFTRPQDPVDGVVIDVRGNVGGIVMMVPGMAGFFIDAPGVHLGTLKTRDSELRLAVNPRAEQFKGPLAVLTDVCSVSAAELLSGGLKATGRARVFGTATAGEALPAMINRLPNGDGFLFVFADYRTSDGQRLEGDGVLPDETVEYDRQALLAGRDPMITAAARWVKQQAGK